MLVSGDNDAKTDSTEPKVDINLGKKTGTDAEVLEREEEAINIDGLNAKELKDLQKKVCCT